MIVKHGRCSTFTTASPFALLSPSLSPSTKSILLVILRQTHRPIPARSLRAHSIKRVAFIPSIFTRDVSSSGAGFLAIRVGSAVAIYFYPYTILVVCEIEGKNTSIRILYGYYLLLFIYSAPSAEILPPDMMVQLNIKSQEWRLKTVSCREIGYLCLNNLWTFIN